MWRKQDGKKEVIDVETGSSFTIPVETHFQFRDTGPEPLSFVIATFSPWPGPDEAVRVNDYWSFT